MEYTPKQGSGIKPAHPTAKAQSLFPLEDRRNKVMRSVTLAAILLALAIYTNVNITKRKTCCLSFCLRQQIVPSYARENSKMLLSCLLLMLIFRIYFISTYALILY